MVARSAGLWLCAWACLGCVVAWGADPRTKERVWTDQQGRKVTAKLIRVERDVVYLDLGDRISQLPFDQLSANDQAFLAAPDPADSAPRGTTKAPPSTGTPPLEEPRVWTINNRQVLAAFAGADDEAVYLKGASGDIRLAYEAILSEADAVEVAGRLRATRPDLADRVVQAYEKNTGEKFPTGTAKPPADDTPLAPTSPVEVTGAQPDPTAPVDEPEREKKKVEIATADQALAAAEKGTPGGSQKADLDRFRNRAMLGGFALVVVVAAVLGFSWLSMKRKPE